MLTAWRSMVGRYLHGTSGDANVDQSCRWAKRNAENAMRQAVTRARSSSRREPYLLERRTFSHAMLWGLPSCPLQLLALLDDLDLAPPPILASTIMLDKPNEPSRLQLRLRALSRWENEGGAPEHQNNDRSVAAHMPSDHPPLSNAELVQLRIRVIALESVVIALLSQADEAQLQRVRDIAVHISPQPGFTHHPLTLHAAAQMSSLVERAQNYQATSDVAEASEKADVPLWP